MLYVRRVVDDQLDRLLADLPAVVIDGPKAVGKTATAMRRAATVIALDDSAEITLVRADRNRLTRRPGPVLVDEWQLHPPVWDQVRRAVDADSTPGRFLLTGSATPTDAPTHTGAGRMVRLRMRPMSLAERGLVSPTVSVAGLLTGARVDIGGTSPITLADYAEEIVASGLPSLRGLPARSRPDTLDGYLDTVVERDFAELGHVVGRPGALRAWLTAFAAATSTTASYNQILDAATAGHPEKPAKTTTIAYPETLARMWLLDELPAWIGARNHLASPGQSPKHHLADPAFAARLLGVGTGALLDRPHPDGVPIPRDGTLLGALFEGLVTLSVRVYADAAGARVSHLRTHRGAHEVDLIVIRDDGRMVALDVTLSPVADDHDVQHLRWLREQVGDDLLDAVMVTTGPAAYRCDDGIAVVPAALIGP
jgi:predicted AAA+ superfamily ATPase